MDKERLIINENQLSYEEINKIKEHAKQYDSIADKKEFLKNAGAYEQKVILLESKRPYEVLNYLSELELETSKKILNSLKYEEIEKILELFTMEDKKKFYETFSALSLVNQFITIDENSKEYVKNLDFDRKVELIDSSSANTAEASEIVYESMPYSEREIASNLVTNADAVSTLSQVETYSKDSMDNEAVEKNNIDSQPINLENPEKIEQKVEDEIEKQQLEQKDKMVEQINMQKNEFFKFALQHYLKTNTEFASLINTPDITYEMLPDNLKAIVDKDFELDKENKKKNLENQQMIEQEKMMEDEIILVEETNKLEVFQTAKVECEQKEIEQIQNVLQSKELEIEKQKTL